jgi:hypothetical protein
MPEDINTLDGAIAFLNRIRAEAKQRGRITLSPAEFVAAVALGAIEYIADVRGVSNVGHHHVGEYKAQISGTPVALAK